VLFKELDAAKRERPIRQSHGSLLYLARHF